MRIIKKIFTLVMGVMLSVVSLMAESEVEIEDVDATTGATSDSSVKVENENTKSITGKYRSGHTKAELTNADIHDLAKAIGDVSEDFIKCIYPLWQKYKDDPYGKFVFALLLSEGYVDIGYAKMEPKTHSIVTLSTQNDKEYDNVFELNAYSSQIALKMMKKARDMNADAIRRSYMSEDDL